MLYNFKQILSNLDQLDVFLQSFDFNLKQNEHIIEEIEELFNNYKHLNTHNQSAIVLLKSERIIDNYKDDLFLVPPSRKTQYYKLMPPKDFSIDEDVKHYSTKSEKIIRTSKN
jgi:hypothetical protein